MDKHSLYLAASELFVALHKFMEALSEDMMSPDVMPPAQASPTESSIPDDPVQEAFDEREIVISLLGRRGEVPPTSRLNMGHSRHYNNHQASILIHTSFWDFFPKPQIPFDVITDDGKTLRMKLSGETSRVLVTTPNYRDLSEYIRDRLGVSIDTQITREMLEEYGRTTISFRRKNECYELDFSTELEGGKTGDICQKSGLYKARGSHHAQILLDKGDRFPACGTARHDVFWELLEDRQEEVPWYSEGEPLSSEDY